jgi:DNA-binding NtrC family response regulator
MAMADELDPVAETAALRVEAPPAQAHAKRCYLLVFDGGSAFVMHVPAGGELIIGRGDDAGLRLSDRAVSRRHARIGFADGGPEVEDLGSHNGTLLNGERFQGTRSMASGDVIAIGLATLVVHHEPASPRRRAPVSLPQLITRLEEEIERSVRYQRAVTLLHLELGSTSAPPSQLVSTMAAELRVLDVVAWAEQRRALALMPEVDPSAARGPAERLLGALRPLAPEARIGFATCPHDGCTANTLLTAARAAAACARAGEIAPAAQATSTLTVGERRIIIADAKMARLFALVERLAGSDLPVLVCGETGVGKELVAEALHHWSPRRAAPIVAINCAAVQETLLESELFGYEKGAFSGAHTQKPGLLESASGGTVFLDEVGELPAAAQAKLLRVLESKRVARLGAVREREIDVRLVAATNRSLEDDIQAGRFRKDLFFRLSAAIVTLPPLRDRPQDLAILARTLLEQACTRHSRPVMTLSPGAMHKLAGYPWPGNVRELRNRMDYLAAAIADQTVEAWHLPEGIAGEAIGAAEPTSADAGAPPGFRNIYDEIAELERARMQAALAAAGGVRVRAAELIGMPLRTFATKLKQYGLVMTDEAGTKRS